MVQQIETYGKLTPQSIGRGANEERLRALADLGKKVSGVAFELGAKSAKKKGRIAGEEAGIQAAESGEMPEENQSLFPTIYGDAYNKAQTSAFIASTDRSAVERLNTLENEFSHDPEGYENSANAMMQGLLENTPDEYKNLLGESIKGYISRGRMRTNDNMLKRGREEAKSELLGSMDTYSREASRASRNGDNEAVQELLVKMDAVGQGLVDNRSWTKEQKDEAVRRARNETTEQAYLQIVDDMPLDEAIKTIDDAEKDVPAGFSGDEWDTLIARARVRLQSKITESKAGQAKDSEAFRNRQAALERDIRIGVGDPDELMLEVTNLFHAGVYDPTKYARLIATVYNDQKKIQKVLDRFIHSDSSIVVDPASVNKVYSKHDEMTPEQKVDFVYSMNMVPDAMQAELKNSLYAGDINQASDAASVIRRLEDVQGLQEILPAKDMAYAAEITKLMEVHTPEMAVDIARKNTDPRDKNRIDARRAEIESDYDYDDWKDGAEKAVGGIFTSIDNMEMDNLASDYKTAFESYYVAGADEDSAQELAEKDIKRVYSDYNGRYMKYSPEKYYQVDGGADWVHTDILNSLNSNIAGAPKIEDYYLLSDDKTASGANEGRPGYFIRYRADDGWNVFPKRYFPDIEKEEELSRKKNYQDILKKRTKPKKKELKGFSEAAMSAM